MDEATAARLKAHTESLLVDIGNRSKGKKPLAIPKDTHPFTQEKAKVRRALISSPSIVREDFSRVATDQAADHLSFKNGVWVEGNVDPKTISKDRRTSEAKTDK